MTASSTIPVGDLTGTLPVGNGGTGATTLTGYVKGNGTSAFTASATVAGSDVLGDISGNAANVNGTVTVAHGGTGLTATPASGQLAIGNGSGFTLANLTAGTGVAIANTAGGITISADGGGELTRAPGTRRPTRLPDLERRHQGLLRPRQRRRHDEPERHHRLRSATTRSSSGTAWQRSTTPTPSPACSVARRGGRRIDRLLLGGSHQHGHRREQPQHRCVHDAQCDGESYRKRNGDKHVFWAFVRYQSKHDSDHNQWAELLPFDVANDWSGNGTRNRPSCFRMGQPILAQ
jgi:hypothetical protein